MITQQILKQLMHYDPETGVFTRLITTNPRAKAGAVAGTKTGDGYLKSQINGRPYLLHRLAWLYMTGEMPPVGILMDHINQVKDDNRFKNLRLADHSLNGQNISQPQNWQSRTSSHRGVHWDSSRSMWFSQIAVSGKKKFLGRYQSEQDALKAYQRAREELHPFSPANDNTVDARITTGAAQVCAA